MEILNFIVIKNKHISRNIAYNNKALIKLGFNAIVVVYIFGLNGVFISRCLV